MSSRRWITEGGEEVAPDDRVAVAHGGRFAGAVVLDPSHVFGRRVGEGGAGPDHAGQRAAARLVEQVAQPRLGGSLCEVARGGPTARPPRPARCASLTGGRPEARTSRTRRRGGRRGGGGRGPGGAPPRAPRRARVGGVFGAHWGPNSTN